MDTLPCRCGMLLDHVDLWDFLAEEIKSRRNEIQDSWVKGHAMRLDIQRGRSSQLDKWGTDGAGALAVAGADMHCVPSEIVQGTMLMLHGGQRRVGC